MSLPPFQAVLDAHRTEVHRFLVATAGPQGAEDCAQETWLAALRAYPRLRPGSNVRAWLLTIAQRKAIDHARAVRRVPVAVAELPDRAGESAGAGASDDVWGRVRALPAKQRAAVGLRYALDLEYGEIARVMGTSQEAARRSVHEGLKRLRREMRDADA